MVRSGVMELQFDDIWVKGQDILRKELNPVSFNTWFQDPKIHDITEDKVTHRVYTVQEQIVNDTRHDGKYFMFAVQFKQGGTIVENIDNTNEIYLEVSYVDNNNT